MSWPAPHRTGRLYRGPGRGGFRWCGPGALVVGSEGQSRRSRGDTAGHGIDAFAAVGIEAVMTFLLVGGILVMVSSVKTARWTPLLVWILVAVLVWQGAQWTGTSLNSARSLAPALLAPHTAGLWIYFVGPLAGSLLAVAVFATLPGLETRTAKLFHGPRYPSTMGTTLPVAPRP